MGLGVCTFSLEGSMKTDERRKQQLALAARAKRLSPERIKQAIAQYRAALEKLARADSAVLGSKSTSSKG